MQLYTLVQQRVQHLLGQSSVVGVVSTHVISDYVSLVGSGPKASGGYQAQGGLKVSPGSGARAHAVQQSGWPCREFHENVSL